MKLPVLVSLAAFLLIAAGDPKDAKDEAKKDAEKVQGVWSVIAAEDAGEKAPAEKLQKMRVTIKGEKMSIEGSREGKTEEVTFRLDTTQKPKAIDVTPIDGPDAGKPILGIYSLDDDTLKICVNPMRGERPKEFVSKPDTRTKLIVLKRKKP